MQHRFPRAAIAVLVAAFTVSCAGNPTPRSPGPVPVVLALPAQLADRAEVLDPQSPDYARADITTAVKPPGEGNVSRAMVVRLTQDVLVFRLWNGPDKRDQNGRTNRIGSWWTYDPPRGDVQQYRVSYEICLSWNDLSWVASCTLKQGAVVAIGPGNSVSAQTCSDPTGQEQYAANNRDWQLYIARAFERIGPQKELDCPDESLDYQADPDDLARPKRGR